MPTCDDICCCLVQLLLAIVHNLYGQRTVEVAAYDTDMYGYVGQLVPATC